MIARAERSSGDRHHTTQPLVWRVRVGLNLVE